MQSAAEICLYAKKRISADGWTNYVHNMEKIFVDHQPNFLPGSRASWLSNCAVTWPGLRSSSMASPTGAGSMRAWRGLLEKDLKSNHHCPRYDLFMDKSWFGQLNLERILKPCLSVHSPSKYNRFFFIFYLNCFRLVRYGSIVLANHLPHTSPEGFWWKCFEVNYHFKVNRPHLFRLIIISKWIDPMFWGTDKRAEPEPGDSGAEGSRVHHLVHGPGFTQHAVCLVQGRHKGQATKMLRVRRSGVWVRMSGFCI